MEKSRFSLLFLEPNEIYYEDFISVLSAHPELKLVSGKLKLCSKSLIFEPDNLHSPLIKILLTDCESISSKANTLFVESRQHAIIFGEHRISPYSYCQKKMLFSFDLSYALAEDCLNHILQLHRASTLPPPERNSMIAAISYSRQCRTKFDPNWLEDIYEKIVLELEASKISPLVMNAGRVVLSSALLYFQPFNNAEKFPVLKMHLNQLTALRKRRFLQRHVGLELFCEESAISHMYLVFKSQEERQILYDAIIQQSGLEISLGEPEIMTLKWQNRNISNFEYLLYLNSIADRSFDDLTQYPVFPWVLTDYTSDKLNLEDKKIYRDLSKPIGALNPDRLNRLKLRRTEIASNSFLYGSHYSAPAFVLFYLIRKYPQYMLCLQNGRFDHPDRIFNCMESLWKNVLENMADFKELIPEFYDTSNGGDFLLNSLDLDLGTRHDGHRVHHVQLPHWAENAADFIKKMRQALESDYVSQNLPAWIDLIFGWRQNGQAAEDADNVFYHLCYEGAVNLDYINDLNERHALEVQIMEFGQTPKKLFTVSHPPRLRNSPMPALTSIADNAKLCDRNTIQLAAHKEHVTCISLNGDIAISAGKDGVLKEFNCLTQEQIRSVQIKTAGISTCILFPGGTIVVMGTFDNRILSYDLECGKMLDEVVVHDDTVSVLCYHEETELMVSGSWDGSIRIWPGVSTTSVMSRLNYLHTKRYDHDAQITCASFDICGNFVSYGTDDGDVYLISTSTFLEILHIQPYKSPILALITANNKVISGSMDGFSIHEVKSGLLVYSACNSIQTASFGLLNFATLLIGSQDGYIECWDLNNVCQIEKIAVSNNPVSVLTVSKCSRFILSGEKNVIVLRSA